MKLAAASTSASATILVFLAGVHANWARGSAWPARTRIELAQAVIGADRLPGPAPSIAVAILLTLAASAVAGFPVRGSPVGRGVSAAVTGVFALRGIVGLSGAMPQTSATFLRWDRRCYAPLCLFIALLASPATMRAPSREP